MVKGGLKLAGIVIRLFVLLHLAMYGSMTSLDGSDCKLTMSGTTYKGSLSVTRTGASCQRWDAVDHPYQSARYFPDNTMSLAENFCRNPGHMANAPWCYTSASGDAWDLCDVTVCDCRTNRAAFDYAGNVSVTLSGKTCQRWDAQEPHRHEYIEDDLFPSGSATSAGNFCRNPGQEEPLGPWCFTTDVDLRWDYCDVPYCDCKEYEAGWFYLGQTSVTVSNKSCQSWSSQSPHPHPYTDPYSYPEMNLTETANYCRNPDASEINGPWCYTTDPETQWEYCDVHLCELPYYGLATTTPETATGSVAPPVLSKSECKFTSSGTSYAGKISQTKSGRTCQRWDQQSPHRHSYENPEWFPERSLSDANNHCRNPDYDEPNGPWCYTTDPNKRWEYCDIPLCDCKITQSGTWYRGTRNTTASGKACQAWTAQTPQQHGYLNPSWYQDGDIAAADNFCRNPELKWPHGTWCYTMDPATRWEHCSVPYCGCMTDNAGLTFRGSINTTLNNRACQRWASQSPHTHSFDDSSFFPDRTIDDAANYCRNPDNRAGGPWCYTSDVTVEWEYCAVPVCELSILNRETPKPISTRSDCRHSTRGQEYVGSVHVTTGNITCQRWDQQSPHAHQFNNPSSFPDSNMADVSNNCRNPNGREGGPWCYTAARDKEWGYCPVPACDCKQSRSGLNYNGTISRTSSGRTCQRWDAQTPHVHSYDDVSKFPDASIDSVGNSCRNPDKDEPYGPWCYTTDAQVRWEYCDVPFCDCKTTVSGLEYGGHMTKTRGGRTCQRWDVQVPHRHVFTDVSMFPNDDSIMDAHNYCRNPDVNEPGGPWCFTTDTFKRWEYCEIPLCAEPTTTSTTSTTPTAKTSIMTSPTTTQKEKPVTKSSKYVAKPTPKIISKNDIKKPGKVSGIRSYQSDMREPGWSVGGIVGLVTGVFIIFLLVVLVVTYFIVCKRHQPFPMSKLVETGGPDVTETTGSDNFSNPVYFSPNMGSHSGPEVAIGNTERKDMQTVKIDNITSGESIY